MFHVPEKFRIKTGPKRTTRQDGNNGAFFVLERALYVIASDGEGWEHVSVSTPSRCPTWYDMCFIKDLFWDDEDLVIQYHPAKADYVNIHPFCLHLWRKAGSNDFCETPPSILV